MKILLFLKKISFVSLFIAFLLFIISCVNRSSGNTVTIPGTQITVDTVKVGGENYSNIPADRRYNDIARYIAGMNSLPGSPYGKLENDSAWKKFQRNFDASWNTITSTRLKPMSDWASKELVEERKSADIFYPLSGPDILHANTFFPDARNYRLYALERNGALPDLDHMTVKAADNYLSDIYTSLSDVFMRSYFITHKMNVSLSKDNVNGTLPLICIFLVRTGHEIITVQYYHLNEDGTETQLKRDTLGTHPNDFVKVYFKNDKNNAVQMVSYMKCDLSDKVFKNNTGLVKFFNKMPMSVSYLKSASYLLHYPFFSIFRNVVLTKSKTILEDDTGIPFKYFHRR